MSTHPAPTHIQNLYNRTVPTPEGHLIWGGPFDRSAPYAKLAGHKRPVRALLLQDRLGRPTIGDVTASCGIFACVAPDHALDRIGRHNTAALERMLNALDDAPPAPGAAETTTTLVPPQSAPAPADPLQRLLLEELPTGTVQDWHPGRYPEITAEQAADNRQALEQALAPARRRAAPTAA